MYLDDEFKQLVRFLESLQHLVDGDHSQHVSVQVSLLDDVPPVLVDLVEPAALLRHLGHDVRRREDGLQIEPGGLHFEPIVENLLHQQQLAFPLPAYKCDCVVHCAVTEDIATDLISASKGRMKGDPIMVCVFTMWSSRRFWMSSMEDRILVPVSR